MESTPKPKQADDPHDVLVVAPDVVRVAPSDEELSNLLQQAARHRSDTLPRAASDLPGAPTVPPVDATFRPAAVGDVGALGKRWSMARRALRAVTALLLTVCIGVAAFVWRSYGDAAEKKIAKWATQFVLTASLPPEKARLPAQPVTPAVQTDAANPAPPRAAPPVQSAAEAVAPAAAIPPGSEQSLQSIARDLASLGQEVVQLRDGIEQLKASQQQISREAARYPEQKPRSGRISAPPPRAAAARPRKPMPPHPATQAAVAPSFPQAAEPHYVPRQPDYVARQIEPPPPQAPAGAPADPEFSSVPRPPMPVR